MAEKVTDPAILAQLNGTPQPVTDPETLAALNAEMHPDDAGLLHSIRKGLAAVDPYVRAAANGMTLGLADRFAAKMDDVTGRRGHDLSDLITGKTGYAGNLEREQAKTDQFAAEHPIGNVAAQTAGAIATLPFMPAARVLEGASLGAKTLAGMGAGAAYGGAQGAFSSHDLTDLPQTIGDAAFGAGIGSVAGGAVPVIGRGVGAGVNWVADAVRSTPGMSRAAARQLLPAMQADGPAAVGAALDRLGPDATLADTGPALLGKAQGASLNSDEGRSILQSRLTARNEGTNARIASDVNRALGPAEDPQTVTDAIRAHRSAVDSKNYPAALNNAPAVEIKPIIEQVESALKRTPSGTMEHKALSNLRNMLTEPVEREAAPAAAAAPAATVDEAAAMHAKNVEAIRAKYGDQVAATFDRQANPANVAKPAQKQSSLLEFLAGKGGLGPDAELGAIGAESHTVNVDGIGRRKLVKQGGLPLDYAREAAEEAGYLQGDHNGTSTVRDLLDAIDAEIRGQKRYPAGFEGHQTAREARAMSEREQAEFDRHMQGFHDDLEAVGHGELNPQVKDRAAKLMADKGLGPDEAVDHALSQLEQEDAARAAQGGFPGDRPQAAAPAAPAAPPAPKSKPVTDAAKLHKVKQELDNVIEYDRPGLGVPAGALQNQQGALKWFRGILNAALEKQVPGYAAANRTSAALAKRAEAVERGTQYLGNGKTTPSPERFASEFEGLSPGERIALAKGSRGNIDRVLGTKANDLQALRGELQGEGGWNTAKIATVHGQDAADELMRSVERNLKFRDTHNKVVENSQTAQRTAAAKAMKPEPSSETPILNPNMTMTGLGATAAKKTAIALANALLRTDPTKSFAEVAKILSANGPEARAYLQALADSLNRRAALSPRLDRLANQASLASMVGGARYLQGRVSSDRERR